MPRTSCGLGRGARGAGACAPVSSGSKWICRLLSATSGGFFQSLGAKRSSVSALGSSSKPAQSKLRFERSGEFIPQLQIPSSESPASSAMWRDALARALSAAWGNAYLSTSSMLSSVENSPARWYVSV